MATIRTTLKQLRNADVRYISLVDRAATRIPFRVLKRDKEHKMGIDLTSVFKRDDAVKPHVSALVVFAQKSEVAGNQVQEAITAHGFGVDQVEKSDEGETLVYAQGDPAEDAQVVRLSDQTLVSVAGLTVPDGWAGEVIGELGFFPDLKMATDLLHDRLSDIVTKSDAPQAEAEATLVSYAGYLTQMAMLPTNCFKLDGAITEIVQKCSCEEKPKDEEDEDKPVAKADAGDVTPEDAAAKKKMLKAEDETEDEKKKRLKSHPPAEMEPADEDDDQKPPPDAVKADKAILKALKGIETTVSGLATKLEGVVTEQGNQKKVLDEVIQKADTFNTTLKTTILANPASEDRPSGSQMRVQKTDTDPRTGAFDTAFLRKQRR